MSKNLRATGLLVYGVSVALPLRTEDPGTQWIVEAMGLVGKTSVSDKKGKGLKDAVDVQLDSPNTDKRTASKAIVSLTRGTDEEAGRPRKISYLNIRGNPVSYCAIGGTSRYQRVVL